MTAPDALTLINRSLSEIGKPCAVDAVETDLFDLGLSSIDRLMLVAKIETLSGRKVDMSRLGTDPHLTVGDLMEALA